ncbi:MAG: hypothetical protein Q9169_000134 [Polycauliona sp. 2 TL-2023]
MDVTRMSKENLDTTYELLYHVWDESPGTSVEGRKPSLRGPDLSPLIYHIPNTHNTLLIRLHNYPLPIVAFASTIRDARLFIAGAIASTSIRPDSRLPTDRDPFEFPRSETPSKVSVRWQSGQDHHLTWGILAVVMKGLEDCLVKNDQLPWVATWHVFDGGQEGEVGWGMIGWWKGTTREVTDA